MRARRRLRAPAVRPPTGLPELVADWSRLVTVRELDGVGRTFHVLDTHARCAIEAVPAVRHTLFCVHGNPSWSYLWRRLLATAPSDVRVVAVDQLDMGFSERTGTLRRLERRVDDLSALTATLGLTGDGATGRLVSVGHDWGGAISLGWALEHLDQLGASVLLNTAVHQPEGAPAPSIIRAVRNTGLLRRVTVDSPAFIVGATDLTTVRPDPEVRRAFLAPYRGADRRAAIQDFVEDIPLEPDHPSAARLDRLAAEVGPGLADTPVLMLWGPADPVFSDRYLHDLEHRLPHADVHRFVGAAHFVSEDADVVSPIWAWLDERVGVDQQPTEREVGDPGAPAVPLTRVTGGERRASQERRPLWHGLEQRANDPDAAVIEMMASDGNGSRPAISFGELWDRTIQVAAGLRAHDVHPGERVALMIPPGIDLSVALSACWRLGTVPVLVDSGLGPRGMSRALASAAPRHLIGIPKALAAARTLGWPGRRFSPAALPESRRRALGAVAELASMTDPNAAPIGDGPAPDDDAIIVFTSGATGPSKGVVYRHHQVEAQRDALMAHYRIGPADRLVAAFAPFALYGPAMGITSVVPDMDVTAPGSLTATALGDAAVAAEATLVFASPAALASVVRTASDLTPCHRQAFERVRTLMSAGAPVRPDLLGAAKALMPNATAHTPYGMTEMLPVADISSPPDDPVADTAIDRRGVSVGAPLSGVEVTIHPFGADPDEPPTSAPGVAGEIIVRAAHGRQGYDRLWYTQHLASQPVGHHRTGDVGSLDEHGRLWVGGRVGHVLHTADGPVMPVGYEQAVERLDGVAMAACVGVGPVGNQVMVIVIQPTTPLRTKAGAASLDRHAAVRSAIAQLAPTELASRSPSTSTQVRNAANVVDVAAVLELRTLPVDRRHNSKVDRARVARWAEKVLAGGRMGAP